MLERRSALAAARPYHSPVLSIAERPGFSLIQVAGLDADFEEKLSAIVGGLPEKVGPVRSQDGRDVMRVGPAQFWIIAPESDDAGAKLQGQCVVTPLSHGRVRIAVSGRPAREVLSRLIPIDLHPSVFEPGHFAMTGIHHTPVTVHCTERDSFDVYVMRTFALNVWEVITDAALEYCG